MLGSPSPMWGLRMCFFGKLSGDLLLLILGPYFENH